MCLGFWLGIGPKGAASVPRYEGKAVGPGGGVGLSGRAGLLIQVGMAMRLGSGNGASKIEPRLHMASGSPAFIEAGGAFVDKSFQQLFIIR